MEQVRKIKKEGANNYLMGGRNRDVARVGKFHWRCLNQDMKETEK